MSGQVIIIDAICNRRILLSAQLDSHSFFVRHAESRAEGQALITERVPDTIIVSHDLPGLNLRQMCKALRRNENTQHVAVIVAVPTENHSARISALSEGAADVIEYSIDAASLRARLRNFMRLIQTERETSRQIGPARAPGFSELALPIHKPVTTLVSPKELLSEIQFDAADYLTVLHATPEQVRRNPDPAIEVFVIFETAQAAESHDLIAALRVHPSTRNSRILFVTREKRGSTASPLDLGADDEVPRKVSDRELRLRITALAMRKRTGDHARKTISDLGTKAYHDSLTGLHNRAYAEEYLAKTDRELATHPRPLALLTADVDHFKLFNDNHGHAAGDAILVHISDILKRNLRNGDVISRFGGEEFLMVLPSVGAGQARCVAQRLRKAIADTPLQLDDRTVLRTTISIGVSLTSRTAAYNTKSLRIAADNALYRAKGLGRNQIQVAHEADYISRSPAPALLQTKS